MALTLALAPMKRRNFLILTVLVYGFTLGGFWVSSINTLTIFPDKDSYSWQSVPLANNGMSNNFEIASYYKPPFNMRGWIEFNLTSIPNDAWVLSATLRLRLWHHTTEDPTQNMGDSAGRIYGVYRLLQPWSETTINWSNQPNYTDLHQANSTVPSQQGGWFGPFVWMDWDISGIMSDWRANSTSNYGLVVRDTQEYSSVFYSTQFFTHDQVPNETYYPRLLVTYVSPLALVVFGGVLVAEGFIMIVLWRSKVERAEV